MARQIDYRSFQPEDIKPILDLFKKTFESEINENFWRWRFRENPFDQTLIELAWSGDILAAQYAVCPIPMQIQGEVCITALSMHTMTHPDFRNQGLFPSLAKRIYDRMTEKGYKMVWGFPNERSHRGFIRNLKWVDIYEIPIFKLHLHLSRKDIKISSQIVEIEKFDSRFDELWQMVRFEHEIWSPRNSLFLDWRFRKNPQHEHHLLGFVNDDNLLGYLVYKNFENGVDIMDILTVPEPQVGLELVLALIDHCRRKDLSTINMWLPVRNALHLELEKLGFDNTAPITYLGCCVFNPLPGGVDATHIKNWHVCMCDSDVY